MSQPRLITGKRQLQAWRAASGPVSLVPTMGALHEGHRALIEAARSGPGPVLVSIFVNPLQFGPGEDYQRYPRTMAADREVCAAAGADLIFAPGDGQMYAAERQASVSAGAMGMVLEGASRPGHFDGVLTVVTKLFSLLRPDRAYFGLKDIQQFALIQRLVIDLDLGVEIVGVPIVRDPDGLALSSRNRYLSPAERQLALLLPEALHAAGSQGPPSARMEQVRGVLTAGGQDPSFRLDYAELVDFATFAPVGDDFTGRAVLALAAWVGDTRLIDNRVLQF